MVYVCAAHMCASCFALCCCLFSVFIDRSTVRFLVLSVTLKFQDIGRFRHCSLQINHVLLLLLLLLLVFTSFPIFFYFEEKAWALLSQLFISVPFMYIMYLQLVCCFITRLQAPIHAFQCLTSQIDTTNLFFPSFIHNFKTCYLIWILLNAFAHLLIACRFFTTFRVVSSFDDTIRFSSNIFLTFPCKPGFGCTINNIDYRWTELL